MQYRDHTDPLFVNFKCLKFQEIVKLKMLLIVFQAKNNMLPVNIQKLFMKSDDAHNHNTRFSKSGNFDVKYCKTKMKSMTISIKGVKLWNELDNHLHNVKSIHLFKKKLKCIYIIICSKLPVT